MGAVWAASCEGRLWTCFEQPWPSCEECQRLFQRVVAMNDENAVLKVRVRMPGQQPCLDERWYPLVN